MELECDKRGMGWRLVAASDKQISSSEAFAMAIQTVSSYRRDKALAFRFEKDRRTSLLAGLLLNELLQGQGLRERDMTYEIGELGKPKFADYPNLHFSLAHSAGMAIGALSNAAIGVDVEHLPSFLYDIAEPLSWTEMESVGKLLGCGIGAFLDAGRYERPPGVKVEHFRLRDYLVCMARDESQYCPDAWDFTYLRLSR